MENEQKELMCLEIYGVHYLELKPLEKHIIDRIYSREIIEQKEVENGKRN